MYGTFNCSDQFSFRVGSIAWAWQWQEVETCCPSLYIYMPIIWTKRWNLRLWDRWRRIKGAFNVLALCSPHCFLASFECKPTKSDGCRLSECFLSHSLRLLPPWLTSGEMLLLSPVAPWCFLWARVMWMAFTCVGFDTSWLPCAPSRSGKSFERQCQPVQSSKRKEQHGADFGPLVMDIHQLNTDLQARLFPSFRGETSPVEFGPYWFDLHFSSPLWSRIWV